MDSQFKMVFLQDLELNSPATDNRSTVTYKPFPLKKVTQNSAEISSTRKDKEPHPDG